ncbi:MAG: hypothetical protein HS114_19285 [Anaerolineales bacterium]|nr:hypothetical protein [Anaerolineales bacterium]
MIIPNLLPSQLAAPGGGRGPAGERPAASLAGWAACTPSGSCWCAQNLAQRAQVGRRCPGLWPIIAVARKLPLLRVRLIGQLSGCEGCGPHRRTAGWVLRARGPFAVKCPN